MIREILQAKKEIVEKALESLLISDRREHDVLYESMNYSLLAGGKRIRPALFLMGLDLFHVCENAYVPVACALECIHTYSLIHDDLPQMDNDDYRRGRFTNHKVYGAGMATMAGDGLLTAAFSLVSEAEEIPPALRCQLIQILAKAAGPSGMVGGQAHDILSEGKHLQFTELQIMDRCKTGCLLMAPLDMAAAVGGASPAMAEALHTYGLHLGQLFQITDDLLDVSGDLEAMGKLPGQDAMMDKSTYVSLMGYEGACQKAKEEAEAAKAIACTFGEAGQALYELPDLLLHRKA